MLGGMGLGDETDSKKRKSKKKRKGSTPKARGAGKEEL